MIFENNLKTTNLTTHVNDDKIFYKIIIINNRIKNATMANEIRQLSVKKSRINVEFVENAWNVTGFVNNIEIGLDKG